MRRRLDRRPDLAAREHLFRVTPCHLPKSSRGRHRLTGTIDIAGGMTVCVYLFPRLIKGFRRHHPEVDVKITTGGMSRIVRRLRAGRSDLALLTLPIEEPGLTTVPVLREELLLIMPPGHALHESKHPLAASALVGERTA